jgi:topoisomerase-4 subunit A
MEQLFRATDLETRLALNMNVLDARNVPRVMGLAEVLEAYLAHRMEVLVRRARHRMAKVEDRLEVLEGYLKAFLDLDEVIRIIREEDEPKAALMRRFELNERQAEAILNLRLRNLRRLEEAELGAERDALLAERAGLEALLGDEGRRRARLKEEFQAARKQFGNGALGRRRTRFAEAPVIDAPRWRSRPSATRSRWSARPRAGSAPCAAPP